MRNSLLLRIAILAALTPNFCWAQNQPPQFRLPTFASPVHYSVNLTVAPDKDTFTGTVDIDLHYQEASSVLWLNAEKLAVKTATLTYGGQTLPAKVISEPKNLVGFSFDRPVGPGPAKFHAEFEGQISRKDMQGIFQVKDGDHWYVYSQFENISARQAFPCFDEPSYKVPWQLTLNVPRDDGTFSNTPMLSETSSDSSMKTVRFAETKPLPSYLVALAVGPMDIVPAGHAGANHTEIRIIVPRGRAPEAQYVAAATPDIVNLLEKYFGIPYPYEKLDEVAIPLAGYAMEHPGLVTYGSGFFLVKPEVMTLAWKRTPTSVIAHELAHQWSGDLVTTAWWDDIWLNEGFASWMANKIVNQYHPEWKMNLNELDGYQNAMYTDELVSSRKVRQSILSDDDIANAFDSITYNKGSALLNMFESYMGPEKFQGGIQRYLRKYAWGNATSAQFFEALGGGDPAVGRAFSTFLDQAGVPLVTVRLECDGHGVRLKLAQQRFLPRGSRGSANQSWNIPICFKYPSDSGEQRSCALMTGLTETVSLAKATGCPKWTYANADAAGYYIVHYQEEMLHALLKDEKTLTLPERVSLIGDIAALTQGYMPLGEAMALVPQFAHHPDRSVVMKTLWIVGNLDDHPVPENLKPEYRRYMSDQYKKRARELGWKAIPGEDDNNRLLRPTLFGVVANHVEDVEFIEQAKKLALAWLEDHKAVDPDMVGTVLNAAARHGDRSLYDRFRAQAKNEADENLRDPLLTAMGLFRDPAIAKDALSIILTNEFDNRESLTILFSASAWPETRDIAYEFVKQNWDALVAKLPTDSGAILPFAAANYCDSQHRADAEAFFKDRATKYSGGPRNLSQVLEGISLCAANKDINQSSVAEFLKNYRSDD
jgi:alanyl aminopeptidase